MIKALFKFQNFKYYFIFICLLVSKAEVDSQDHNQEDEN